MTEVTIAEEGITVIIGEYGATAGGGVMTPSEIKVAYESNADTNAYTDADLAKLAAIEAGATADQSGAEIKALYEAEANTNAYTDAELAKLAAIEAGATADQSGAEIKALYEAEANTNAFTDAEKTKLAGLESSKYLGTYASLVALQTAHPAPTIGSYAHVDAGVGNDVKVYIWDDDDDAYVEQLGASSAETAASIKTKYESNPDTNAYTDAEKAKLGGIEAGATADQTGAEIKALYEAEANTNAFTDAEKTKLGGIEAGATADQSAAEILALYNSVVAQISAPEIAAGTEVAVRRFSPKDVADMIAAHGGGSSYGDNVPFELGDAADLSFVHDGSDSKVVSTTGHLIFDNQNSVGFTEFHLGSDSSSSGWAVKNNSGLKLIEVLGNADTYIGDAGGATIGNITVQATSNAKFIVKRATSGNYAAFGLRTASTTFIGSHGSNRDFYIRQNNAAVDHVRFVKDQDYQAEFLVPIQAPKYTTTARDALTATDKTAYIIFNTTTVQFEGYNGSGWVAL